MSTKPTEKQNAFAIAMFTTGSETFGNGTESARIAGYKGSDNMLAVIANGNIRKDKIIELKKQIQAKTMKKYDYNRDIAVNMLFRAHTLAVEQKSIAGLVSVIRELDNICGLQSQTIIHGEEQRPVELSEEERAAYKRLSTLKLRQG